MSDANSPEGRRRLLKALAVGGGAVVVGNSLPASWMKPVIESVVLPTHAQASGSDINYYDAMEDFFESPDDEGFFNDVKICIQSDGGGLSIKVLEEYSIDAEWYYYEGSGSIGTEVILTQPTACDDMWCVIQVDTVDSSNAIGTFTLFDDEGIYTGPHAITIPLGACGFDVEDAVCSGGGVQVGRGGHRPRP